MKSKKPYTVVGLYHDNKQVWVGGETAESVEAAVKQAKASVLGGCNECAGDADSGGDEDCSTCEGTGQVTQIAVLSVFEGEHRDVYGEDELIED